MSTEVHLGRRVEPYLGIARARFLLLPVTLVALGGAAGAQSGTLDPLRTGLALAGLIALHVAVNALNEASDYERGIDLETEETPFSGGSGTLPEGDLSPTAARRFGLVAAGAGALIGAYFLYEVGLVLLPLVVFGAITVVGYTDLLARVGLGEVAAGLGLGGLPVIGVALVQDGTVGPAAFAAAVPATLLTFDLLLLNEFPDEGPDRRGGRTNLVLALGRRWAALAYVIVGLAVPASIVGAVGLGYLPAIALLGALPSVALFRPATWAVTDPESEVPVDALRDNVAWILGTNATLAGAMAVPVEAFFATSGIAVNEGVFLLGRGLFGVVVATMAFNNLVDLDGVGEQIGDAGVPYPRLATAVTSVPLLVAGLLVATGTYPTVGAAYMVVFMLGATVVVHDFWTVDDPEEQENQVFHFLKNLLILAAVLVFLALGLGGVEWPLAVGA